MLTDDSTHRESTVGVTDKHSGGGLLRTAERLFDGVKEGLLGYSFGPASSFARKLIIAYFDRIQVGKLVIDDVAGGCTLVFPVDSSASKSTTTPYAKITVKNAAFWLRLLLMNDVGFSEAYMFGDIDVDDLTELFKVAVAILFINCLLTIYSSSSLTENISAKCRHCHRICTAVWRMR